MRTEQIVLNLSSTISYYEIWPIDLYQAGLKYMVSFVEHLQICEMT